MSNWHRLKRKPTFVPPQVATMQWNWHMDGIGCGRCYTYFMACDRPDCPGSPPASPAVTHTGDR